MDYINKTKDKKLKTKSKNGLALLELILAIAILSIISFIIAEIVIRSGIIFEKQQGQVNSSLANRFVLDDIVANVRSSQQVEATFTGDGQTFNTDSTTLVLKIPSINSSGDTIPGLFDRVVFYLDTEKIYKKVFPDSASARKKTTQILTSSTKTLSFTYNNQNVASSSAVTVDLTTKTKLPSGTQENTDKIQAVLRNY